jgi:alkylated DNA repair dioxygenase AlkB
MASELLETGAIRLVPQFLSNPQALFEHLAATVAWDTRMKARKSASFGLPYNYSGITWPVGPFPVAVAELLPSITAAARFEPNNCLANYYPDGESSMGFHSDSTAELAPETGVAVLSVGAERVITFRRSADKAASESYRLPSGSLLWMCPEMQAEWKHAVLADPDVREGRISLTFRRIAN